MKISLRDKKISPWDIILFLRDKKISPWDMKIPNFIMWFKNGLKTHKLLAQCVKRVGIKKALQEVACCCSLAGDFYLVIGLTCEALPN